MHQPQSEFGHGEELPPETVPSEGHGQTPQSTGPQAAVTASQDSSLHALEQIFDAALEWSKRRDTLAQSFLAAEWLRGNGITPPVDSVILRLAHHAFASPPSDVPESLEQDTTVLDHVSGLAADQRPAGWAVGAGLFLMQGWLPALPLFLSEDWTADASPPRRRTVEALTSYWHQAEESLPSILHRLGTRRQDPKGGNGPRQMARRTFQAMLTRQMKFPLGVKILAYLRDDELVWLEREISDPSVEGPSPRLAAWAKDLDPARDLNAWAAKVDPDHRTGIVGRARAALRRDLADLRTSLLNWVALAPPTPSERNDLDTQERIVGDLTKTLRVEAQNWCDGWGDDGSAAMGRLLISQVMDTLQLGSTAEGGL